MKRLFHLATLIEWTAASKRATDSWSPASLADQGFVHLSFADQLAGTLELHFPTGPAWLLEVEGEGLGDLRLEPSRADQLFPHLYGPLPLDRVQQHWRLERGPGGWTPPRLGELSGDDHPQGHPGPPPWE